MNISLRTLLFLSLLLLAVGCNRGGSATPQAAKGAEAVVSVTVEKPKKSTLRWTVEQPGGIEPFEVTPLAAKLPGYVAKLFVDRDDRVSGPRVGADGKKEPGMLLAQISIPEIEQEYKQKAAQKEQAKQEVALARKNEEVARASYAVAQQLVKEAAAGEKRAEANYQRWKGESVRVDDLVRRNVIDKQTGEETHNQYISAESTRDEAMAHRQSSEAAVIESKAKLDRAGLEIQAALARQAFAEADYDRVAALLEYTQIRAPYDGVVTDRHVHTGAFLQANGSPVLTVSRIDPVRIVVDVPEVAAERVSKGSKATVRVQALRGAEFQGQVARTSWTLSPTHRSLRVEIDLPNPDGKIRPGNYAYASIPVEIPDVLTVPQSALFYQDEVTFCWAVEDGKAARYQIQTGQRDGDRVEIIRRKKGNEVWKPVTGDEQIIVTHKGPVTEGLKVEVNQ